MMPDMEEDCIVCLGTLRSHLPDESEDEPSSPGSHASSSTRHQKPRHTGKRTNDAESIAHLLPCKHNLHDECLVPWVERANSCPICRSTFNEVEVKDYIDGPTITSYAVQDKQQQAEVEPLPAQDEELPDEDEGCIICSTIDTAQDLMYCDGCDRSVHIFCAGDDEEPADIYYCRDCCGRLEAGRVLPLAGGEPYATTQARRPVAARRPPRRRQRRPNSDWARVWQSVWNRTNLDLDFPFDDEPAVARRTPAQQRDFAAWERRLRVANHQGAAGRFRAAAPASLRVEQPRPESQEELSAWNAFDKAREISGEELQRRKRKATEPPESPREVESARDRKLKRPRTQAMRALDSTTRPTRSLPESSAQAQTRQPGFLASLLQEVERRAASSDPASPTSAGPDDQTSAGPMSSPDWSPITSNHGTPRGGSVTPPPLSLPRPAVTPISSNIRPLLSPPIAFSPFSPIDGSGLRPPRDARGRPAWQASSPSCDRSPQSPSRLSYSTKAEVQRMVKSALGSRYRDQEITKDQYTDINRDVSRLLYEQIDEANDLADYNSRNRLQKLAVDEVQKAVDALSI